MSVVLIIIISALVQSILTCIVIRKKNIRIRIYMENIILLWISFDYYILSVTKYYLGYKWENLLDSFWNAQTVTFIPVSYTHLDVYKRQEFLLLGLLFLCRLPLLCMETLKHFCVMKLPFEILFFMTVSYTHLKSGMVPIVSSINM